MKTRVLAPAVGIIVALLAAGCGGGGSSPATPDPGPPPPPPPSTPQPPAAPTSANSVARVKAAMSGAHEATSPALTSGVFFIDMPKVERASAPAGSVALGGWGQVMAATGHVASSTARVQLRNFETFAYANARWNRVQQGSRVTGANYPANYAGAATEATDLRPEASGGVSVRPAANSIFRFWPESGVTKTLIDELGTVTAVFTTVQARVVSATGAELLDTGSALYVVNTGADWWSSVEQASPYSSAGAYRSAIASNATSSRVGGGKLQLASGYWQAMSFHSGNDAQANALDVDGGSGRALTNSALLAPRAVTRIVPIGDSITQGSVPGVQGSGATSPGNDSYRRVLWNELVKDATLPIVDFVGTRTGTVTLAGGCERTDATVPANGAYGLPEFDTAHEAYWGICTDQFVSFLPAKLATLATSSRLETPDVALVHLGSNDLNQAPVQAASEIVDELKDVVRALRAANPGLRTALAQLIPLGSNGGIATLNAELAANNASLAVLGATLVDQNTDFSVGSDTWDGIHPDDSGERKMALKWLAAIKAMLP